MENEAKFSVRVCPNASRNEIIGLSEGTLRVKIAAPPLRGKANKELISLLSRALEISKNYITIVHGQTSRNKIISVSGLSYQQVITRIQDFG